MLGLFHVLVSCCRCEGLNEAANEVQELKKTSSSNNIWTWKVNWRLHLANDNQSNTRVWSTTTLWHSNSQDVACAIYFNKLYFGHPPFLSHAWISADTMHKRATHTITQCSLSLIYLYYFLYFLLIVSLNTYQGQLFWINNEPYSWWLTFVVKLFYVWLK